MKKLRVMTILGTRPEIIRLSRVIARFDATLDHCLVHTGQNWDYELNEIFFDELGLRKPDHFLGAGGGSVGEVLGGILSGSEKAIVKEKPDAVVVLGDTNSALSAIMARRLRIPIYHLEAGNRSFDRNVPEETNRKVVDHVADFNLVYTEHARRHLLSEGLSHRRINLIGSPMREVLNFYGSQIDKSDALLRAGLNPRGYILVSLHREENVDSDDRLRTLLAAINDVAEKYDIPAVMSTHPRTRARLESLSDSETTRILFMKPFGFFDYNKLQVNAFCVISDSGTIAEESSLLGFPAITPRDSIERPEAVDAGAIVLTGVNRDVIRESVGIVTDAFFARERAGIARPVPVDYMIENTSERVLNLVLGTAKLSNQWDGIRSR